jgi:hypothetical protein
MDEADREIEWIEAMRREIRKRGGRHSEKTKTAGEANGSDGAAKVIPFQGKAAG